MQCLLSEMEVEPLQSISSISGSIGEDSNALAGLSYMIQVEHFIPKCVMLQGAQVCAVWGKRGNI